MVSFCRGRGFQHDPNAASPATKFRPVPEPDAKSIEVAFAVLKTLNSFCQGDNR